jgi:hypothetical protein
MCLLPHLHLRTETDPVSETSCSLEYQTMDKVQNPSNSVCYTASSEPFRIYIVNFVTTITIFSLGKREGIALYSCLYRNYNFNRILTEFKIRLIISTSVFRSTDNLRNRRDETDDGRTRPYHVARTNGVSG